MTTAGGFTQTRTDTTANATFGVLGAVSGFNAIELHQISLREP
jgi:hypothetical protein